MLENTLLEKVKNIHISLSELYENTGIIDICPYDKNVQLETLYFFRAFEESNEIFVKKRIRDDEFPYEASLVIDDFKFFTILDEKEYKEFVLKEVV